jgi:hypothetical protein
LLDDGFEFDPEVRAFLNKEKSREGIVDGLDLLMEFELLTLWASVMSRDIGDNCDKTS